MSVSLIADFKSFAAAANAVVADSERTFPEFANSRMLFVAKKAIEDTEKADANRIAYQLAGNVRTKIRISRKTGKRKAVRQYDVMEDSLAARIVNAKLKAAGQSLIWGRELAKAARRLIGARLRSVAFIRSGWVYAIRTLAPLVGQSSIAPGATKMSGQVKGYAYPARFAISSVVKCEIGNTALIEDKRSPMAIAERGLSSAVRREQSEMLARWQKKLQPVMDKYSAR